MGQVFDSQFHAMQDASARQGTYIEVAYTHSGRVDYVYETGRLLASAEAVTLVRDALPPGVDEAGEDQQPDDPALRVLSIENLLSGVYLTVPQALDLIDAQLGDRNPALHGGFPLVTAVQMMHFANGGATPDTVRHCPATEPEVPCRCAPDEPCGPCPPVAPDGGAGVVIGVCDTGLLANTASAAWLGGVNGEVDSLG